MSSRKSEMKTKVVKSGDAILQYLTDYVKTRRKIWEEIAICKECQRRLMTNIIKSNFKNFLKTKKNSICERLKSKESVSR